MSGRMYPRSLFQRWLAEETTSHDPREVVDHRVAIIDHRRMRLFNILHPIQWWRRRRADRFLSGLSPEERGIVLSMPLIRSVYPNQIAQALVSVQPMQGPTAQVFNINNRTDDWAPPAGVDRGTIRFEPRIIVHEKEPPKEPIKHIRKLRIPDGHDA